MEFVLFLIRGLEAAVAFLWNALVAVANFLWSAIVFLAGKLVAVTRALFLWARRVWENVIKGPLVRLAQLLRDLRERLDRFLRPLLRWLERIRKLLDDYFFRYIAPLLNFIQTLRRVLLVFRLAGFRFAKRLDARLFRLETQIAGAFLLVRGHLNAIFNYLNLLQRLDLFLGVTGSVLGAIGIPVTQARLRSDLVESIRSRSYLQEPAIVALRADLDSFVGGG